MIQKYTKDTSLIINELTLQFRNKIIVIISLSKFIDFIKKGIILLLKNSAEMKRLKISIRFYHPHKENRYNLVVIIKKLQKYFFLMTAK